MLESRGVTTVVGVDRNSLSDVGDTSTRHACAPISDSGFVTNGNVKRETPEAIGKAMLSHWELGTAFKNPKQRGDSL